jgi:Protein of unknown function (DUF 659)/hAT family C-terminal dimerisation region
LAARASRKQKAHFKVTPLFGVSKHWQKTFFQRIFSFKWSGNPLQRFSKLSRMLKKEKNPPHTKLYVSYALYADLKPMTECKHCTKKLAKNATRQFNHLCKCQKYLDYCASNSIQNNVTRKVGVHAESINQLPVHELSAREKEDLDVRAARVCLVGGYPFTLFESEEMKYFCNGMNSAYKPPTRQRIAGDLLDRVYHDIQADINTFLKSNDMLNIVTDESSNINHSRICNISIQTPVGALHYVSEDVESTRLDATGYALWLSQHLLRITNNDISRINSITTDTCATMQAMEKQLQLSDQFKHVFFIPCGSHSIQLLIKDILAIPRLKSILSDAQAIASAFHKSPLQLAYLREQQINCYGKHYSLVLSVITRWGTQYRLIHSVLRSKEALRKYAENVRDADVKRLGTKVHAIIKDADFWRDLDILRELLKPIDELLKMSESSKGHLGQVLQRWIEMLKHLKCKETDIPELVDFAKEDGTFAKRFKRQVVPIHILAYYLRSDNINVPMTAEHEIICFKFLEKFLPNTQDLHTAWAEFQQFRGQIEPFIKSRPCWIFGDKPHLFWVNMKDHAPILGNIAIRIFQTPTNSVASEHSFSIEGHLHNKLRASLLSKTVNKLTYTYINGRLLRKIELLKGDKKEESLKSLTNEEEVELENILLVNDGVEGDLITVNENNDGLMEPDEEVDENSATQAVDTEDEEDDSEI